MKDYLLNTVEDILYFSPTRTSNLRILATLLFVVIGEILLFYTIFTQGAKDSETQIVVYVITFVCQFALSVGWVFFQVFKTALLRVLFLLVTLFYSILGVYILNELPIYATLTLAIVIGQFLVIAFIEKERRNIALISPLYKIATLGCILMLYAQVVAFTSHEINLNFMYVFLSINLFSSCVFWLVANVIPSYKVREQILYFPWYLFLLNTTFLGIMFLAAILGIV